MENDQIKKLISKGFASKEAIENSQNSNLKNFLNNPFIFDFIAAGFNLKIEDVKDMSENATIALDNELIQKALLKKEISLKAVLNVSPFGIEALGYPSVIKCVVNKLRSFRLYAHKCSIEKILTIKSKEELKEVIKEHQKMLKKNPFSFLTVPAELQDEIHEMKNKFLSK